MLQPSGTTELSQQGLQLIMGGDASSLAAAVSWASPVNLFIRISLSASSLLPPASLTE